METEARETIGDAMAIAEQLHAQLKVKARLIEPAQSAYQTAFEFNASISAILVVVIGVMALVRLKRAQPVSA